MSDVRVNVTLLAAPDAPETLVAMSAKLCYSGAQIGDLKQKTETADQTAFVTKLSKLGHESPLEHVSFTFGVEGVSRALLAQITRHRIASFSVQSQRYVDQAGNQFNYIVPPKIAAMGVGAIALYSFQMEQIKRWYNQWIELLGGGESAKEDARFILPNAAETRMVVTMNVRELKHFFRLRCCERAQWEIRALAWAMMGIVYAKAPSLFSDCGPACVSGKCAEGEMSCGMQSYIREKWSDMLSFVSAFKNDPDFEKRICEWSSLHA